VSIIFDNNKTTAVAFLPMNKGFVSFKKPSSAYLDRNLGEGIPVTVLISGLNCMEGIRMVQALTEI